VQMNSSNLESAQEINARRIRACTCPMQIGGFRRPYRILPPDTRATARMAMPGRDLRLRVQRQSKFRRWELTVIALTFPLRPTVVGLRRDEHSFPEQGRVGRPL
jgi:hypothetical protein